MHPLYTPVGLFERRGIHFSEAREEHGLGLGQILRLLRERKALKHLMYRRLYARPEWTKAIVDQFHKLYYDSQMFGGTWANTLWLGIPILKCPTDMWVYQEMLFELKPDVVIECGTSRGGSALYLATRCDALDSGRIITIDIEDRAGRPRHDRIEYLLGSSTSEEIVGRVRELVGDEEDALVLLDSDHSKRHVLDELRIYSQFVKKGGYLVVEDTNVNGHPVEPDFGPGPMEAVEEFLRENGDFEIDKAREKFYLSFNPNGYLKRIR